MRCKKTNYPLLARDLEERIRRSFPRISCQIAIPAPAIATDVFRTAKKYFSAVMQRLQDDRGLPMPYVD
ncbi:hypothetical protein SAMN05421783_13510 [Thiocapsa roseopersicina]|uniref:Uncharacterized protein n=1 Tax=Thiocapsa roseopersicina TaxID=1058 RepID=A0A1H3CKH7_THIRO|nr:hypothetical protein SAMN05421783_13510 [Thiocapsa roseopersicina]